MNIEMCGCGEPAIGRLENGDNVCKYHLRRRNIEIELNKKRVKRTRYHWTKVIPVDPGWYPVIMKDGGKRVLKLVHEYGQARWYWGFAILTTVLQSVEVWAPRIEFPPLPK